MAATPHRLVLLTLCLVLALESMAFAANPKPVPTKADIPFGPHPHQLLDLYLPPEGKGPFPVVIWYGPDVVPCLPVSIAGLAGRRNSRAAHQQRDGRLLPKAGFPGGSNDPQWLPKRMGSLQYGTHRGRSPARAFLKLRSPPRTSVRGGPSARTRAGRKVRGDYFLDHTSLIWSVSVSIFCRSRDSGSIHTFPFANRKDRRINRVTNRGTVPIFVRRKWDCPLTKCDSYSFAGPKWTQYHARLPCRNPLRQEATSTEDTS